MFMKAILHNKEDDLHFLLKCLVEELEETSLIKKEDKEGSEKELAELNKKKIELEKKLKESEGTKKEKELYLKLTGLKKKIRNLEETARFSQEDKEQAERKKADDEAVEEENTKFRSYLVNTLGEKLTEADIKSHNKMYNGFQNWVLGNQSAQRTIDTLLGAGGKTFNSQGSIRNQQRKIEEMKDFGVWRGRRKGKKGKKLSDYNRPQGNKKENLYRPATEKEIKDAEKTLKVLNEMKEEAFARLNAPHKQYKDMLDKLKAGKDFYMTNKLEGKIKLKNADVKRAIEQREQILFPPPKKVSYEEALGTTDKALLDKLKELLDDKDIKRALGEMVEISQRNIPLEADNAKQQAITQAFVEDRPRGGEKSVKGSKQLEMYLRVLGIIEKELAKLKRQAKPTTQKKIDALENKISDLETLFENFDKKKNQLGISSSAKEDTAYRPKKDTRTYYTRLQKALEKFKAKLKSTKTPEERAISARRLFNTKQLKNIETVMSVLDIIDNKEISIDKLQVLREREGKLRELVESHKTQEIGTKHLTRKVAREAKQKQKDYNKHIKELETTMVQIKNLEQSKRTKEGKLPTREADPENLPSKPSKQVKPMDDKKYREALSPNSLRTFNSQKEKLEKELSQMKNYETYLESVEKDRKEKISSLEKNLKDNASLISRLKEEDKKAKTENKILPKEKHKPANQYKLYMDKHNKAMQRIKEYYNSIKDKKGYEAKKKKLQSDLRRTKRRIKELSLKKQDFEAYRRYDIDRNKKIEVRTTPFSETATYAEDITKAITKIRELLSTEIDGKTIEEELRSSLNYKKTDISREGKDKRKKLREFIAGKKKELQGKRKGKEQMKSTLSKTLIRQITYIEEDMSDSLMEFLSKFFPNTTLKAELPNLTYLALPQKTPEEIKERKEKYFEKVNENRMKEGKEKIEYSFKLGEKPKSTEKNQIKGEVRKYLKILPTLVEKGNLAKPTGEALGEIRESHIQIGNIMEDLVAEFIRETDAKKKKEKLELKEAKELVLERELMRLQNIFKAYENDIDDLLKVFKAIEEFVENYTKQRDEYIKVVEKIQAIRPQTYNKVKWSEIVEKPLPKRKVSLPTARRQ